MTEPRIQKVLIDAGVLLDHPDIISSIRNKHNVPILLAEAIPILIDYRTQPSAQGRNAERVLSQIQGTHASQAKAFPTKEPIFEGDLLAEFIFDGDPAYILKRQTFAAQSAAGRLLEVANQYRMTLVTCDDQLLAQAKANGVPCHKWPHTTPARQTTLKPVAAFPSGELTPFTLHRTPKSVAMQRLPCKALPGIGEVVTTPAGKALKLTKQISQGGEGVIYATSNPGLVCKIYHAEELTVFRRQKIELMVTRRIERPGICWPTDAVFNQHSEFVGYLMPMAQGKTLFSGVFVKPEFLINFPNWGRIDLLNLCLAFLEHIRYLHSMNILVGDINPHNLLVTQDSKKVWMVDTDSFQIEGFPCPVGTVTFTAPEIQNVDYKTFMRTKEHELFAVATMLFMILLPGKPPYAQQNGGTLADNIKAKNFPYRDFDDKENFSGENAPEGIWQSIWNHLKRDVRVAFQETFRERKDVSLEEWIKLLSRYRHNMASKYFGNEVFPTSFYFIRDPIQVACGRCNGTITASKKLVDKKALKGHKVWCQDCHKKHRLTRMARESYEKGQQAERNNQGRPTPPPPITRPVVSPRPVPAQPQPRPQPTAQAQAAQSRPVQAQSPRPQLQQTSPAQNNRPHSPAQPQRPAPQSVRSQPQTGRRKSKVADFLGKLWRALFSN
ncbi:hypothetical protein K5D57_24180 [Pseudomonas cichorii]|nr:hypothetical protein [Pseudomonas cichorii]MBX8552984.1 hypothetical protein [Pseudomonas cichorii]MBX8562823.1 hypothetical protein [Pseudomonas cichorii]